MAAKRQKILRNLFKGLSLTAAAFIFQACYGAPQDYKADICINGTVKSKESGEPIEGIKVSVEAMQVHETTDENGMFYLYMPIADVYKLDFEDINLKTYLSSDTVIHYADSRTITLDISLDSE